MEHPLRSLQSGSLSDLEGDGVLKILDERFGFIFKIIPQYFPLSISLYNPMDFVIFLLIYTDASPVLIVEVNPSAEFRFNSK
jgi:hypothetical protein